MIIKYHFQLNTIQVRVLDLFWTSELLEISLGNYLKIYTSVKFERFNGESHGSHPKSPR